MHTTTFTDKWGAKCSLAYSNLLDIVHSTVQLAETLGGPKLQGATMNVVLAIDKTVVWKVGATRCDVHLHCWGDNVASHDVRRWSTWWIMDCSETTYNLQQADRAAELNKQICEVQADCTTLWNDSVIRFTVILTGDGALMQNAAGELQHRGCWLCDTPELLHTAADIPLENSLGCMYPAISPNNRIGDYVHCIARVSTAFWCRLLRMLTHLPFPSTAARTQCRTQGSSPHHEPLYTQLLSSPCTNKPFPQNTPPPPSTNKPNFTHPQKDPCIH